MMRACRILHLIPQMLGEQHVLILCKPSISRHAVRQDKAEHRESPTTKGCIADCAFDDS